MGAHADVPRILPCLPGARLTGDSGDGKYSGSVTLRLGPIKLAFDGQAELLRQDDAAHIAWLRGSGSDPKGRGAVSSEFSFALEPAAGGTAVAVTTRLELSGSVAQYGRGSGMITEVAGRILAEFERNLSVMLTQGLAARRSSQLLATSGRAARRRMREGRRRARPRRQGLTPATDRRRRRRCCSRRRRCWPRPRRCWRRSSPGDRQPAGASPGRPPN